MRAKPVHGYYRLCGQCNSWLDAGELDDTTVYWHDESERVYYDGINHEYLFDDRAGEIVIWVCGSCDAASQTEPAFRDKLWMCSSCDTLHETKDEGDECCE